jgi:hypothetical protein
VGRKKCAVRRRQCAGKAGDGKGEWKVNVRRGEPCVRPNRNEQEEKKGDRMWMVLTGDCYAVW